MIGIVIGVLAVAAIALALVANKFTTNVGSFPILISFGAVGVVVARRQPDNPIGWTLLGVSGFFVLSGAAGLYAFLDYRVHHGHLPLGPVALVLQPGWAPAIVLMGLGVWLFPDGRLPSRLRWAFRGVLAVGGLWWAGAMAVAVGAVLTNTVRVESTGDLVQLDKQTGIVVWWGVTQIVFFTLLGLSWLVWLPAQIGRYRRSTGVRRQQLKWLISGASLTVIGGGLSIGFSSASSTWGRIFSALGTAGLVALPIFMGVAMLRYRLYDIDRLISRSVSYAIVTGLLAALYVGMITLATRALPLSSGVGVAASTLAAAAVFSPLRRRVQRRVDRRFNRNRYDAEVTVAAFSASLRDAIDLNRIERELVDVVQRAIEPSRVSVWLRPEM
ncbi:MAG: hypothetical protein QOD07_2336 [Frankiaceae bacterium]|nr:hypothetical protein [Frankiaceae bacterium]